MRYQYTNDMTFLRVFEIRDYQKIKEGELVCWCQLEKHAEHITQILNDEDMLARIEVKRKELE